MAETKKNLELPTITLGTQWSWDQDVTNVAQSWGQSVTGLMSLLLVYSVGLELLNVNSVLSLNTLV